MMRRLSAFVFVLCSVLISAMVVLPGSASAGVAAGCKTSPLGLPTWFQYLDVGDNGSGDKCAIIGPKKSGTDDLDWERAIPRVGLAIVDILLRVAGIIAIGYIIYGGFRYILSQGEPDATKKAKGTIIGALIGLIVTVFAASIVGFVGSILWK